MDYLASLMTNSTILETVLYDIFGYVVAGGSKPTERLSSYPERSIATSGGTCNQF